MNIKKLFNNKVSKFVSSVIETDETIVEKIHNEFDTASDRALAEATAILNGIKNIPKEKAELMKKLGFINTNEVLKVSKEDEIIHRNRNRAEVIEKYSNKYPQYKFIFWDQVEAICNKYNLVCGQSHLYNGDIPYKNLQEIDNFKIEEEDYYYVSMFNEYPERYSSPNHRHRWTNNSKSPYYSDYSKEVSLIDNNKIPFFICAPEKEMNMENHKRNGVFLERHIPDPIVLHPMKDGALIVSKWGVEADDEILN
jgi:hypothetical protein